MDLFMMNCELLAVCSALGYLEGDTYFKEEDCIDSVKCLIKYLQNEDNTRDIRTQLGAAHILQNDLLPILTQYPEDQDLFSCVLRLVINLTQPALLCFNGKVPKDTVMHYHFLNVVSYNQDYKEAFGKNDLVWNVLKKKIYSILEVNWEDRKPEESLLVERSLVLLRNLLHTPATTEDYRKTNQEMSSQDSLIWKMHMSDFDDLILYMVGSNDEQEWMLHLIEIICLILKEQNAVQLAEVDESTSKAREREGDELCAMRKTEETRRKIARANFTSRHSRFGGTYVARGTKALSDDNDVILHRSLQHCTSMSFDDGKTPVKKARNRRAIIDEVIERHSSRGVRKILNSFCKGFLERGYNLCMRITKDRLLRENAQDHDETFYFWMMSFFLKFNRSSDFKVEYVSETLNLATLNFLDSNLLSYYELMLNDKHESPAWSRRLHLALRCYHEFLMSVQLMSHSEDVKMQQSAKVLLNNIFYVVEHREILVIILRRFDERKQCRAFLRDAVLTTHLFLKMFENFCKDGTVVVEKKVKKTKPRRKSAKKKKQAQPAVKELTRDEKERKWDSICEEVTQYLQNLNKETLEVQQVFDPASDLTESEQQQIALYKIQNLLIENQISDAAKYYFSARNIWPETGIFGSVGSSSEEETNDMREILLADLSSVAKLQTPEPIPMEGEEPEPMEDNNDEDDEEIAAASRLQKTKREIELGYEEYIKKFANSNVIHAYATLLRSYETNGQHLNHCIVKMLHRIAYQLKMYGFLFQASIFRLFQQIHSTSKYDQSYREIVALGNWVLRKFFDVFQSNPVVIAELLFWKQNAIQCFEICNGYGTGTVHQKKKLKKPWSDAENEELERLFNEHRSKLESGALLDAIMSHIEDADRARGDIKSQLFKLGLVDETSSEHLKGDKGPGIWRAEDIEELKTLFNDHKEDHDAVGNIVYMLHRKYSKKRVINKIIDLGLVIDRKCLRKKRTRRRDTDQPGTSRSTEPTQHDSDDSDASGDNDDENVEKDQHPGLSIPDLLVQMKEDDESTALLDSFKWLSRSLQQILNSQASSSSASSSSSSGASQQQASLPLVPFNENEELAIVHPAFKSLLFKIGVQPPSADQIFWRIPRSLPTIQVQSVVTELNNKTIEEDTQDSSTIRSTQHIIEPDDEPDEDDDDDDDINVAKRRRIATILADDDDDDSD